MQSARTQHTGTDSGSAGDMQIQAANVDRTPQRLRGGLPTNSKTVSAATSGMQSKESLYTMNDAPLVPTHAVLPPAAAPAAGGYNRYADNSYSRTVTAW